VKNVKDLYMIKCTFNRRKGQNNYNLFVQHEMNLKKKYCELLDGKSLLLKHFSKVVHWSTNHLLSSVTFEISLWKWELHL
jgi:hypothetical protein